MKEKELYHYHLVQLIQKKIERLQIQMEKKKKEYVLACIKKEKESLCFLVQQAITNKTTIGLEYISDIFQCSDFEKHILTILLTMQLSHTISCFIREFHQSFDTYITPYFAQMLYEIPISSYEVSQTFTEDSLFCRFLLKLDSKDKSQLEQKIYLPERIKVFLLQEISIYSPYEFYMTIWNPMKQLESFLGEVKQLENLETLLTKKSICAIRFVGESGCGKKYRIKYLAKHWNIALNFLSLERTLFLEETQWNEIVFCYIRECILLQAIPVLVEEKNSYYEYPIEQRVTYLMQQLQQFPIFFITAEEEIQKESNKVLSIPIKSLSFIERIQFWKQEAKNYSISDIDNVITMANQFLFTYGKIKEALQLSYYYSILAGKEEITIQDLKKGCYCLVEKSMGNRAVKVKPIYNWEQLILPEEQKQLLADVCNQVKYNYLVYEQWGLKESIAYGRGISMIFYGASGTGKTMAAAIVAREIGLELYKVQLATIVSKYIGETEKNLEEIFERAKKSNVVLFFDEADILFSKRTEVKEANDKYNNMEAAFMLQKIEEYEGITILATNYIQNFDEAFRRRIKYCIEFVFPDKKSREKIWSCTIPKHMPKEELDIEFLSYFILSGSQIKNIVLHSAFLAAARQEKVTMKHILKAIKQEYKKHGKVITKEEFGEYYVLLETDST